MPRIIVSGSKSKNPGKKYLQYDPQVKGDLSKTAQDLYDKQRVAFDAYRKLEDAFISHMKAEIKAAGTSADVVVMLRFGKVTIDIATNAPRAAKTGATDLASVGDLTAALG